MTSCNGALSFEIYFVAQVHTHKTYFSSSIGSTAHLERETPRTVYVVVYSTKIARPSVEDNRQLGGQ